MCRIALIYTEAELKALDQKSRKALQKLGTRLVHHSREIRAIVQKDPKVRRKLKAKLRPTFNRLKRR